MSTTGPPFFVVGSARSGTTLLRMMLNAHPLVAVPPESRFVVELWRGRAEVDADEQLAALAAHGRWAEWDIPLEAVRGQLGRTGPVPYADVMTAAFRAYAAAHGKARWGDKTPRYVLHLDLITRLWPDARFVHLVRDGRDVALSYADVPFGPSTVVEAAGLWAERVRAGRSAGRALGDAYLELGYEELVDDPRGRLEELCDFLLLPFDPAMLEYGRRSRAVMLERSRVHNPHIADAPRRTRSWRESMADDLVELFEAVAGDLLSELGYERRFERPRGRIRLLAAAARLGAPVGRLKGGRT